MPQFLKPMIANAMEAELAVRESTYVQVIEGHVADRNQKFAGLYKKLDVIVDLVTILSNNVHTNSSNIPFLFGGAATLLGILYYGASYVHADGAKPTLARHLSDAIAPPKLPQKDSDLEKMMNGMTVASPRTGGGGSGGGSGGRSSPLSNAEDLSPLFPELPDAEGIRKEFAIALGRQGSSTDTVVASTVPTILVDQSGKEPSILIDSKDVKFYLQARDMKRSGDQSIKGRLMNRQREGVFGTEAWYQHEHGAFSIDDALHIDVVKEWGRKYSNKEGATDEDFIKKGITMLPLARFDDSTQGRWAALVLDKILSRQNVFANFRTDEAIELAKTPRAPTRPMRPRS